MAKYTLRYVPNSHLTTLNPIEASPGRFLREVRRHLGLNLQDVQDASGLLAKHESNQEMYVSAARLHQIENEESSPSIHKLLSISAIYGLDFLDLVARYGVKPDRVHEYRKLLQGKRTHPVSTDLYSFESTITFPIKMDPRFRWETTQLINRMVAVWGEIPACLLMNFNARKHILGLVGLQDHTMSPLIRPGALLLVDGDRRKVVESEWRSEQERPIYFIELRDEYRCAWCQLADSRLTLVSHPLSRVPIESFSFPGEAEIVGQVVGIAMRLVPVIETSREQ